MAKRRKELADLSGSEWAVMKALWEGREMAAGEVYGVLAQERDWAYPTVRTLLRRLVAKGWVDAQRVGNSYLYRPAVPRDKAVRRAVREFSTRVLDGLLTPFVAYYIEEHDLSPEEVAQLEAIVRRQREKGGTR